MSNARTTPGSSPAQWLATVLLTALFLLIFMVDRRWGTVLLAGFFVTSVAIFILFFLRTSGILTWMRLARAPARALARDDVAGAERAFDRALARARRFPPRDARRARMLAELAEYLKQVGRFPHARELLEESVEILDGQWKSCPVDYFIALNNYAVIHINLHRYGAAQSILEKVLDQSLVWSKGGLKQESVVLFAGRFNTMLELTLHLNLVVLFVNIDQLDLAGDHLEEADGLVGQLKKNQHPFVDQYRRVRALFLVALGRPAMAEDELRQVKNSNHPGYLAVRAKISLAQKDFPQAEELLRKYLQFAGKHSSALRPDFLEPTLDLAESLFGAGKFDDAFAQVKQAQAITLDGGMANTPIWRKALARWSTRAQQLNRASDIDWLQAELRQRSAEPEESITVSPRLRIRASTASVED